MAIPVHNPEEPPRSAEAIPVHNPHEPPRSAEAIPVRKVSEPPKSAEAIPVTEAVEPVRPSTVPPTLRIETITPGVLAGLAQAAPPEPVAPPPRVRSRRHAPGSDRAAFEPAPVVPTKPRRPKPVEPVMEPIDVKSLISAGWAQASAKASELASHRPKVKMPAISAYWPRERPAWLIPAMVGGGFALILLINIIFYIAYFGGGGSAPVATADPKPAEVASRVDPTPAPLPSTPVEAPPVEEVAPSTSVAPAKPASIRPVEPAGDGLMNTRQIVAKYEASVALIRGKKGSGTGFVARWGIVATNSHVIEAERIKDVEVRFPSAPEGRQGPFPVRLLFQDKDRDLALLGVATDLAPVPLAEDYKFRKGEDVTVIGNPGAGGQMVLENAISRGVVSTMTKLKDHTFLQLGIAINPGNSGGPVFDPRGRVIGVVTLKTVNREGLAFAVPASDLLAALETAETAGGADPIVARGRDRESTARPPANPPPARNRLDNDQLSRLLGDLRAPDNARRRESLRALHDARPMEPRRAEVARVLDRSAADPDLGVRGDAIRAMGVWGDGKTLDNLITTLSDPNFGVRDELFEAIARLSPTEKSAEAIVPWLATEPERAAKALRAIGPAAETPLLRAIEDGGDPKVRREACRVLKDVGTLESISALESLARRAGDDQVARDAGEAIKAILGRQ